MLRRSGLSKETEARIDRICSGLVGFAFGAIALDTPAARNLWAVALIALVVPLVLWRAPE